MATRLFARSSLQPHCASFSSSPISRSNIIFNLRDLITFGRDHYGFSIRALSTSTENPIQKLERIANDLLSLNQLERHDYAILFRHKMGLHRSGPESSGHKYSLLFKHNMGLNRYGPELSGVVASSGPSRSGAGAKAADAKPAEKTAFDVKLEKFDAAAKIKVIKEVRGFTELGLKEAKDLVEKTPVVLKKGVTKEEAQAIVEKLKGIGATAVLE